jgi:L-threonylcarbamoyladenylate synthase
VAAVADAVRALRAGAAVIIPTDTVYGVCVRAADERAVRRLYRLKRRPDADPLALLAPDLETLLEAVPELRDGQETLLRGLLPGPYTLVLGNPRGRYPWLQRSNPDAIGVRVPALRDEARSLLEQAGVVAATSANLHGGPDPRLLADVPRELRAGCRAALDGGVLPGVASTVLDLTGEEPRVLREGAVPAAEALEHVRAHR